MENFGKMVVTANKAGTFTLTYHVKGRQPQRWRAGIPTHAEALSRARTVAAALKLKVVDTTKEGR